MANPTHPPAGPFRAELDGQIIEADGSTITDPASGADLPAVLLRMTRTRAHTLAHILDDWSRVALVFATLRSSQVTERALAWTLDASAAAAGDPDAARCALRVAEAPFSDFVAQPPGPSRSGRVDRLLGSDVVAGHVVGSSSPISSETPDQTMRFGSMIKVGSIPAVGSPASRTAAPRDKADAMAKGQKCPKCGNYTLQPYTTNQLRCSQCGTIVKKDQIS